MLLPVVATAVALGLLAPFGFAIAWRVPFGFLPTTLVLRSSLVTALSTFVIGGLASGVAEMAGGTESLSGIHGAVIGGTFMATMTWLRARRSRELRGILLLAVRVGDPTTRERASELLTHAMRRAMPAPDAPIADYLQLTMMVVSALSTTERFAEAAAHLEALDEARLDETQGALVAQALATCRVRTGDTEAARRALTRVPRPVTAEPIERWMVTLGALLDAIDGGSEAALSAIDALGDVDDAALGASLELVRAHAFAAMGREREARSALVALESAAGAAGLAQALVPVGPASPLARQMAAGEEGVVDGEASQP